MKTHIFYKAFLFIAVLGLSLTLIPSLQAVSVQQPPQIQIVPPIYWHVDSNSLNYTCNDNTPNNPPQCGSITTPCCSIEVAVKNALQHADFKHKIKIAPGIHRETVLLMSLDPGQNKAITIEGAGADQTFINGDTNENGTGNGPVFYLRNLSSTFTALTFAQLTIEKGHTGGYGGGISIGGGGYIHPAVTVRDSTLTLNEANFGGAIGVMGTTVPPITLQLKNVTIHNNEATSAGGGIFNFVKGILNIQDSTIDHNESGAAAGGGVYNAGTLSVAGSTFSNNQSGTDGGGIHIYQLYPAGPQTFTIANSTITGNEADANGGGIYYYDNANVAKTLYLSNVTITDNKADFDDANGGAGGGLYSDLSMVNLANTLLAGNKDNTINNPNDPNPAPDCFGSQVTSGGYSIVGDNSGCNLAAGVKVGTSLEPIDPKLAPLADNSGKTKTHALLPDSLAIDAGDPTGCKDSNNVSLTRDQRGVFRLGQCDITAYEFSCGDGVKQNNEFCDGGGETATCNVDCTTALCSDGKVNAANDEECDDADIDNTDDCLNNCKLASCGDGHVYNGVEACDDGNLVDGDGCQSNCALPTCGDAIVDAGEDCDDGNVSNTDDCLNTCLNASCGDGFVHSVDEECDDANDDNTDACPDTCKHAKCGDGFVHSGVEDCDDGDADNTDSCLDTCKPASCGDGFVRKGIEACDDGNNVDNDACTNACALSSCGDGALQGSEECDDGNKSNTDACLNTCLRTSCGDTFVQAGEKCDDGNNKSNDGCDANCQLEAGVPPTPDEEVVPAEEITEEEGEPAVAEEKKVTAAEKPSGCSLLRP